MMRNMRYYIPGSILILIAILILAVPEILIAFIASIIIMFGIGALYIGHIIKKSAVDFKDLNNRSEDDVFYRDWFTRSPRIKRWIKYF